jgi:hypothetical protein
VAWLAPLRTLLSVAVAPSALVILHYTSVAVIDDLREQPPIRSGLVREQKVLTQGWQLCAHIS